MASFDGPEQKRIDKEALGMSASKLRLCVFGQVRAPE